MPSLGECLPALDWETLQHYHHGGLLLHLDVHISHLSGAAQYRFQNTHDQECKNPDCSPNVMLFSHLIKICGLISELLHGKDSHIRSMLTSPRPGCQDSAAITLAFAVHACAKSSSNWHPPVNPPKPPPLQPCHHGNPCSHHQIPTFILT